MGGMKAVVRYATCFLGVLALWSSSGLADTTTERSGSILIFPKIVFDGSRDTFIQISNTSNSMVHAQCFYVNAAFECVNGGGDCRNNTCTGFCVRQWQEVDYHIWLTKQQPTSWAAGIGRIAFPSDDSCRSDLFRPDRDSAECYGAGIDPGRVPPVAYPFEGELKCIEVDPSGAPISGNHLKGEATIVSIYGDTSAYNAIAVLGLDGNNGDTTLCLGGEEDEETDECPSGAEYNPCPDTLILNHFAEGADDPLLGYESEVDTELTLIPCTQNFETQNPTAVVVQFAITNEFEQAFSASTTVECWGNFFLTDINPVFGVLPLGTRLVQTRMRPATSTDSGILGVMEEYHSIYDLTARAAFNLHQEGQRTTTDLIVIPQGP